MTAARHDFDLTTSASFDETLNWQDSLGVTFLLATYTGELTIRHEKDDSVLANLTVGNGGIVLTDTDPNIQLIILKTATALLPEGSHPYDLFVTTAGGKTDPLLRGFFDTRKSQIT